MEARHLPGVRRRARLRVHHDDRRTAADLRPLPDALADRTIACPFCGENDKQRITSFATPDGTYRVTACQTCRRYLKTLDGRRAGRPVMPAVDAIATLPLDAVVMQRGFSNG